MIVRYKPRCKTLALAVTAFSLFGVSLTAMSGSAVYAAATQAEKPAAAQTSLSQTAKGLLITPARDFIKLEAGKQKAGKFTVANLTDKPAKVVLSVKQFSVSDYTYDYQFADPPNDWIKLEVTEVELAPGASRTIAYSITVPKGGATGGQYYTLFASTELKDTKSGGLQGTVQAASLLYLTVDGKLVQTSRLQSSSLPRASFGRNLVYSLDILNTGNVHYVAYVSGNLHGGLGIGGDRQQESSHLLLPGKPRAISGSIKAPRLPGVYKLTAGYRTDADSTTHQVSRYVFFVPQWSLLVLLAVLLAWLTIYRKRRIYRLKQ